MQTMPALFRNERGALVGHPVESNSANSNVDVAGTGGVRCIELSELDANK
jgi:hypothetical protein